MFTYREQPIFTTRAHVFHIDPATKKNWIPASGQAVPVSFFFDSNRSTYRIISVEGTKAVINSTVTPNMVFTKTSQKFGQWADPRANTIYGLGFGSEADLAQFIEKFKEVKEATRIVSQKQQNGTLQSSPRDGSTGDLSGTPTKTLGPSSPAYIPSAPESPISGPKSPSSFPTMEAQLKYENEKLKIALAQSSANAKKWEVELQTLKNNNARLTAALHESTSNVDEWKKQLQAYKEECATLRSQLTNKCDGPESSSQASGVPPAAAAAPPPPAQWPEELRTRIGALESENELKEKEIASLRLQLDEMELDMTKATAAQDKLKAVEEESSSLQQQISRLEKELADARAPQQKAADMQQQLGRHLQDATALNEQITSVLKGT
ncbi:PREDICTED: homer protein homolog 2-like isoform X2 [Priapulus caudatus]|uniref:Homer protein homolog 2-like isoform X2 n=1 Tax=Priapulus caudatus TaxID=37621 RepID=A0ABM1DPH9_PRICU|nr:PREDICTED: homer protein homolog 2-like isoform X2 [Priapulus caudatus]